MRRAFSFLITAVLLLLGCGSARAGDDDTHYFLTYFLAIQVGYSQDQARQIASADMGVDYDPNTRPDTAGNTIPRWKYHAFINTRIEGNQARLDARESQIEKILWAEAVATKNPGRYLHAKEDSFFHLHKDGSPYEDKVGHLSDGHEPDFLSNNPERAKKMVDAIIADLVRFRTEVLHEQPKPIDRNLVTKALNYLIQVNPPIHPDSLVERVSSKLKPDSQRTKQVLESLLHQPIPDPVVITFDPKGNPVDTQGKALALTPNLPLVEKKASDEVVAWHLTRSTYSYTYHDGTIAGPFPALDWYYPTREMADSDAKTYEDKIFHSPACVITQVVLKRGDKRIYWSPPK